MANEILYAGDVARINITLRDRKTKAPIPMPNASIPVKIKKSGIVDTLTFAPATDGSNGRFTFVTSLGYLTKGTYELQPEPTDLVGPFAADPDFIDVRAKI